VRGAERGRQRGRRYGKALLGEVVGWFAPEYKLQAEVFNDLAAMLVPVIYQRLNQKRRNHATVEVRRYARCSGVYIYAGHSGFEWGATPICVVGADRPSQLV
jgi:hypothetical protein